MWIITCLRWPDILELHGVQSLGFSGEVLTFSSSSSVTDIGWFDLVVCVQYVSIQRLKEDTSTFLSHRKWSLLHEPLGFLEQGVSASQSNCCLGHKSLQRVLVWSSQGLCSMCPLQAAKCRIGVAVSITCSALDSLCDCGQVTQSLYASVPDL